MGLTARVWRKNFAGWVVGTSTGLFVPLREFTQFVVGKARFSCNTQFVDAGTQERVTKPGALLVMPSVGTATIFTKPLPDWKPATERKTGPVIDYLAKDYDSFRHTMITAMMARVLAAILLST